MEIWFKQKINNKYNYPICFRLKNLANRISQIETFANLLFVSTKVTFILKNSFFKIQFNLPKLNKSNYFRFVYSQCCKSRSISTQSPLYTTLTDH